MKAWIKWLVWVFWAGTMSQISMLGYAQFPGWQKMGIESGLLSEETYKVFQDKRGYIWTFTEFGPQIHNGRQFEKPPGFPSPLPVFYNQQTDRNGDLLFYASNGQLGNYRQDSFYVDPASAKSTKLTVGRNSLVYNFLKGKSGDYYLQTFSSVLHWNEQHLDTLPMENSPKWIVFKKDGLWFGNRNGNYIFGKTENGKEQGVQLEIRDYTPKPISIELPYVDLIQYRYMALECRQGLLVSVGKWAFLIERNAKITRHRFKSGVIFIKTIGKNCFLGLYNEGLAKLGNDLNDLQYSFPGLSVSDVFLDKQGRYWVSTLESGVFSEKEIGQTWESEVEDKISMLKLFGHHLYVGTENGKLYQSKIIGHSGSLPLPVLSPNKVFDMVPFGKNLLISTNMGVFIWDKGKIFTRLPNNQNRAFTVGTFFCVLPDKRILCAHTRGFMWAKANGLHFQLKTDFKTREMAWLDNRLWVATDNGLRLFRVEKEEIIPDTVLFTDHKVMGLKLLKNEVWASVLGKGLYRFKTVSDFNSTPGIPESNPILDWFISDAKDLITAGLNGVFSYQFSGKNQKYELEKQILDQTTSRILLWQNRLWMGTKTGLVSMPWPEPKSGNMIPVYLKAFSENSVTRKFRQGMSLDASNQQLDCQFDVLDYGRQNAPLSFLLSGPKSESGQTSSAFLSFKNLPPGNYVLSVFHPKNTKGEALKLRFSVQYEFWEIWWFKILAALILLVALFLLVRAIVWFYRKKDAEANRIQQLLAGYKLTALQSQMNPHFVSNALSAIQHLILSQQIQKANDYLTKFSRMLRRVLDYSDRQFISLEEEIAVIQVNVELEQLRFRQDFEFRTEIDPSLSLKDVLIPSLITQPMVENAIWHGLLPLDGKRMGILIVRIFQQGESYLLEIEDNGIGFETNKNESEKSSKGILVARERIESLNKWRRSSDCHFEIKHLKSDSGQAIGTCVQFRFPIHLIQT